MANRAAEQDQLSVVAVFGGPKESSEEYLATARVGIPVIGNANFASAGVAATPTILVASQDGRVSGYWRGRLTPARQDELLRKVGLL